MCTNQERIKGTEEASSVHTGKNNRFPFLDILGYLKNTHKNPKFGRVRQVQSGNLVGNSLDGTCLTLPNLGFLWVFFNPFAPGDFADKRVLKLLEWFSGHCRAIKS